MNKSPKSELFFSFFFFLIRDSFGIEGMKHFLGNDDKKIVGKVLKDIETIDQKDKKLTFCKLKFSIGPYEKLKENENNKVSELSKSVKTFFHLRRKFVNILMLKDSIQMSNTVTCGAFQILFLQKAFFLDEKS